MNFFDLYKEPFRFDLEKYYTEISKLEEFKKASADFDKTLNLINNKFLDLHDKPLTPIIEKGYILYCTPEQFNEAKSTDLFTIDTENNFTQESRIVLNIKSSTQLRDALFAAIHKKLKSHIKEAYCKLLQKINSSGSVDREHMFQITKKEYKALVSRYEIFKKYDVREPIVSQLIYDIILSKVIERLKYEDVISNKRFIIPNFNEIIHSLTSIETDINILKAKTECNLIRNIHSLNFSLPVKNMSTSEINSLREMGYVMGFKNDHINIDDDISNPENSELLELIMYIPDNNILEKLKGKSIHYHYRMDKKLSDEIVKFIKSTLEKHMSADLITYNEGLLTMFIQTRFSVKDIQKIYKKKIKKLRNSLNEIDESITLYDILIPHMLTRFKYKDVLAFINNDSIGKIQFINEMLGIPYIKYAIDIHLRKSKIALLNKNLKYLSDKNKKQEQKNSTIHTKTKIESIIDLFNFDSLFKDQDKEFTLSMLEDLAITRGGRSILTNRKKSRLRGFVEALVEYHIIPDDNIDNLCEIFADQIGMQYNARLKCSDLSEKTKKSTIDYIKKHH